MMDTTNSPIDHLEKILNTLISVQNKFEQFKEVVSLTDEFDELMKIPHIKMLWEDLCKLSKQSADIGNDRSWKSQS